MVQATGQDDAHTESSDAITEKLERMLAGQVSAMGLRLLEVQFRKEGRWVLRLVIDRGTTGPENGVTLDDCSRVSELANRMLDVEDIIPQSYSLEVTSPGVFRALKERRHFEQSTGLTALINLVPDCLPEMKSRSIRGVILVVQEQSVSLEPLDRPGERLEIPLDGIRSARLDPDIG
ncbi:MAG: ribosome maturation factor RimP [Deltaproteobacteria bacterium]|nr:ribosome maturation factor RimP [Deltaproteobacteria bacterium]